MLINKGSKLRNTESAELDSYSVGKEAGYVPIRHLAHNRLKFGFPTLVSNRIRLLTDSGSKSYRLKVFTTDAFL